MSMVLLGMVLGIIYFGNYQSPPATPTARFSDAPDVIKAVFAFLGSYLDFSMDGDLETKKIKAIILGVLMFFLAILALFINFPYNRKQRKIIIPPSFPVFMMATFMLIFMSSVIVVNSRIVGYGFSTILTSRYKIYSILFYTLFSCIISGTS